MLNTFVSTYYDADPTDDGRRQSPSTKSIPFPDDFHELNVRSGLNPPEEIPQTSSSSFSNS
jgi:hypothetical protein